MSAILKKLTLPKNVLLSTAAGAVIAVAVAGSASAETITTTPFTWSPSAVGLNGGDIVNATNFNVADFGSIAINNASGAFKESGVLRVKPEFLNGGAPVPSTGLGTTYSLYFAFDATGTQSPVPTTTGGVAPGTFNSVNYTLYGLNGPDPSVSVNAQSNGGVTLSGNSGAFALAMGNLITGTGFTSLQKTNDDPNQPQHHFSPSANVDLTFNPVSSEAAFFKAPSPTTIQFLIGNFGATDSVTTVTTSGDTTNVLINGGGGNFTLGSTTTPVPEPASLALLGGGLLGLGLLRGRRKAS